MDPGHRRCLAGLLCLAALWTLAPSYGIAQGTAVLPAGEPRHVERVAKLAPNLRPWLGPLTHHHASFRGIRRVDNGRLRFRKNEHMELRVTKRGRLMVLDYATHDGRHTGAEEALEHTEYGEIVAEQLSKNGRSVLLTVSPFTAINSAHFSVGLVNHLSQILGSETPIGYEGAPSHLNRRFYITLGEEGSIDASRILPPERARIAFRDVEFWMRRRGHLLEELVGNQVAEDAEIDLMPWYRTTGSTTLKLAGNQITAKSEVIDPTTVTLHRSGDRLELTSESRVGDRQEVRIPERVVGRITERNMIDESVRLSVELRRQDNEGAGTDWLLRTLFARGIGQAAPDVVRVHGAGFPELERMQLILKRSGRAIICRNRRLSEFGDVTYSADVRDDLGRPRSRVNLVQYPQDVVTLLNLHLASAL